MAQLIHMGVGVLFDAKNERRISGSEHRLLVQNVYLENLLLLHPAKVIEEEEKIKTTHKQRAFVEELMIKRSFKRRDPEERLVEKWATITECLDVAKGRIKYPVLVQMCAAREGTHQFTGKWFSERENRILDISLGFEFTEISWSMLNQVHGHLIKKVKTKDLSKFTYGHPMLRHFVDFLTLTALCHIPFQKFVDIGSKYHKIAKISLKPFKAYRPCLNSYDQVYLRDH